MLCGTVGSVCLYKHMFRYKKYTCGKGYIVRIHVSIFGRKYQIKEKLGNSDKARVIVEWAVDT
jgi:hypothetical protein